MNLPALFTPSQRLVALNRQDIARAKQDLRTQVDLLEAGIRENLASNEHETHLEQFFLDGIYIRKFYMPAHALVVSRVHALESFSIISKGVVSIATEDGHRVVSAGTHFFAPAGTKRALLTHEEVIWSTIHLNPDNERDEKILDARYTQPEVRDLTPEEINELYEETV